jgi:hypothetical protein
MPTSNNPEPGRAPNGMWMITVDTITGPWHVASYLHRTPIREPKTMWCVVNMLTGDACRIGPAKGRGVNYCDRARDEARSRNKRFFVEHVTDLPTFMGINPKFDSVISLVLANTDKTMTAQQLFDRKRGF